MRKKAFITGVTGQDGSYLAELLLEKGYEVHGLVRRSSIRKLDRIEHLLKDVHEAKNFFLHYGDVTDSLNLTRVISDIKPDEIYNLAAQSHVRVSFETPLYTAESDAMGALRLLETVHALGLKDKTRIYQASTSELYGSSPAPQNEETPFRPRSPYAIAKLYAYWATVNYREAYDMFSSNGILFNHESPRRGETFVTRKITLGVSSIAHGLSEKIYLGNIDSLRDWGHAKDYVEAMWKMLQLDKPMDIVIATGEAHSVREFLEKSFKWCDIEIEWQGSGVDEKAINKKTGKTVVEIDPYYFRPTEVDHLCGDITKAKEFLGWEPKIKFEELVGNMMKSDFDLVGRSKEQ